MRSAWREAQAVNVEEGDITPSLVAYSRTMCERLVA